MASNVSLTQDVISLLGRVYAWIFFNTNSRWSHEKSTVQSRWTIDARILNLFHLTEIQFIIFCAHLFVIFICCQKDATFIRARYFYFFSLVSTSSCHWPDPNWKCARCHMNALGKGIILKSINMTSYRHMLATFLLIRTICFPPLLKRQLSNATWFKTIQRPAIG